jgi:hypothetical protein
VSAAARRQELLALLGNEDLAGIAHLPDGALIRGPDRWTRDAQYATTTAGLRQLIRQTLAALFPGTDPAEYEADIAHEGQHAAAAAALGCSSRFIFRVARLRDGSWYTVPAHTFVSQRPLTKLALAAISAAPAWLSEGDLADLHRMGYAGADDVADRIRKSGQHLPVPASARAPR